MKDESAIKKETVDFDDLTSQKKRLKINERNILEKITRKIFFFHLYF